MLVRGDRVRRRLRLCAALLAVLYGMAAGHEAVLALASVGAAQHGHHHHHGHEHGPAPSDAPSDSSHHDDSHCSLCLLASAAAPLAAGVSPVPPAAQILLPVMWDDGEAVPVQVAGVHPLRGPPASLPLS